MTQSKTHNTDHLKGIFQSFLAKKQLRLTNQRLAVFEAALNHPSQFTAEELIKSIDASASRASVYRTLILLVECNLVREIDVGRDFKYFAANICPNAFQAQIICSDCDKIFEIDAPFMEWYGANAANKLGLDAKSYRLQVSSDCQKVKQGSQCPHKCISDISLSS